MITRHFIDVGRRRVHYRMAGSGPALLMVHQSPRSSAEYEPLMERLAQHFTCIAPDTPGFGQSDPLPMADPDIADFADANIALLDALGLDRVGAYGFHSGGIILVTAMAKHPARFTALAVGGYAIWTPEERALFDREYLPPFRPTAYGEHLAWLWHRVMEQSWVFPWFDMREQARLPGAHARLAAVDAVVRELLDSGDAYRLGYGAVLRAPRDIPSADAQVPPVLIGAYDGDPLQAHIDRLGPLPHGWRAEKFTTPQAWEDAALAFLQTHPAASAAPLPEADDAGFMHVGAAGFDGLLHWRGRRDARRVVLPAPGGAAELIDASDALVIDPPGHGLSDDWPEGSAPGLGDWATVIAAALPERPVTVAGEGLSALLALAVGARSGAGHVGAIDALVPRERLDDLVPDVSPDRFGGYLHRAWAIARAERLFFPWFAAGAVQAIPIDPSMMTPERLALRHRAMIRARAGKRLAQALFDADRDALVAAAPPLAEWHLPDWAHDRADIWRP